MNNIRNFSIIAHIDHGKSTLADRMLEITHTIDKRQMREQVLDTMELERERGITIKMQPVRMVYRPNLKFKISNLKFNENSKLKIENSDSEYILNLIDTPGHIDFSYEVSRALRAVEGSILLVDATQGVQAQTLTTLGQAVSAGLVIIPAISKIDSPLSRVEETAKEVCKLLNCEADKVLRVSGKTGEGVEKLLEEIVKRVPAPRHSMSGSFQSLVFDFKYSSHKGVIVFVRVFEGEVRRGDKLKFKVAGKEFQALEVGIFSPEGESMLSPAESLKAGEIGYIVTGIKEPGVASVGDTVASVGSHDSPALPGYEIPRAVVWASVYPENQDDFVMLRQSLSRLRLSDSAFSFEEESRPTAEGGQASGILGRGFRCGFLGMLHLEIITERLRREFNLPLVITLPSIVYHVTDKAGKTYAIYSPALFPEEHLIAKVREPWVSGALILPPKYLGAILVLLHKFEAEVGITESFGENRTSIKFEMPLRELMRGFFDKLKSATSGYGSISYSLAGEREAEVTRLDILVADEPVPAFAKVVGRKQVEAEAEMAVEKLHKILPRQMFSLKIQGRALGRIISSRSLSGMKKDVTAHMYGGDITRKMKLREKQKKGKKKMKERGRVSIPQDVFLKMLKRD